MHIQIKMNAYKEFYIFACISVTKTYVTGLDLKDKKRSTLKIFSFSSQITLMAL